MHSPVSSQHMDSVVDTTTQISIHLGIFMRRTIRPQILRLPLEEENPLQIPRASAVGQKCLAATVPDVLFAHTAAVVVASGALAGLTGSPRDVLKDLLRRSQSK